MRFNFRKLSGKTSDLVKEDDVNRLATGMGVINWEFSVSVSPIDQERYCIKVENVPEGGILAETVVSWPVQEWLMNAKQLMGNPLANILQKPGSKTADNFVPNLVDLGQALHNALLQDSIRDSWLMSQAIAQHYHSVLRFRLGLKGPVLPRLPWEVMHCWNSSIAAAGYATFSRYQAYPRIPLHAKYRSPATAQLRMLVVIASPLDQDELAIQREVISLRTELAKSTSPIEISILEHPGREELAYALEHGNYQIFHYSGHSGLGVNGGNLYLVNNQTGLTEILSGNDLAGLLLNNGVQLAVFNSCRGVYTAEVETTTGNLAQSLVNQGIPAVLAMSERIPDHVAVALSRLFYRNLSQGYPVDLSLSRARQGLIAAYGSQQLYWALPVLYLHPEWDGFLLKQNQPAHPWQIFTEDDRPMLSRAVSSLDSQEIPLVDPKEMAGFLEPEPPPPVSLPQVNRVVTRSPAVAAPARPASPNLGRILLLLILSLASGALGFMGWWWYQNQAQVEAAQPLPDVAIPFALDLSRVDPKTTDPQILVAIATEQLRTGDIPGAKAILQDLLNRQALSAAQIILDRTSSPDDPEIWFLRGRLAWQGYKANGQTLDQARRFWENATASQPDVIAYSNALAFVHYEQGNFAKAAELWSKNLRALELNPNQATVQDKLDAQAGLAIASRQLGEANRNPAILNQAIQLYDYIMATDPAGHQPDALAQKWLWTTRTIQDWSALGQIRRK